MAKKHDDPGTQALFQLTEGKKYSPDKIYSASTDGRGHYEQVRVKLPPSIEHLISQVTGEHDEFRGREDFIRNAIFHALHRWITEAPNPEPRLLAALQAEQARAEMEMLQRFNEAHEEAILRASDAINDLLSAKDWDELNELVEMLDTFAADDTIPAGFRARYEQVADDGRAAIIKELRSRKRRR